MASFACRGIASEKLGFYQIKREHDTEHAFSDTKLDYLEDAKFRRANRPFFRVAILQIPPTRPSRSFAIVIRSRTLSDLRKSKYGTFLCQFLNEHGDQLV